jgi:acylphosphatase
MDRIRFRVTGRVQGVGFRAFVQWTASRLGLGGWVRNCWDGAVEGEAEGTDAALVELQVELRRGPGTSHVETLVVEPMPALSRQEPFRIARDG